MEFGLKVKKAIKKIAAISTGALMVGSTIAGALAASDLSTLPQPFVGATTSTFDAYVVVGSQGTDPAGLAMDVAGAVDIAMAFAQKSKTTSTSTTGSATLALKSVAGMTGAGNPGEGVEGTYGTVRLGYGSEIGSAWALPNHTLTIGTTNYTAVENLTVQGNATYDLNVEVPINQIVYMSSLLDSNNAVICTLSGSVCSALLGKYLYYFGEKRYIENWTSNYNVVLGDTETFTHGTATGETDLSIPFELTMTNGKTFKVTDSKDTTDDVYFSYDGGSFQWTAGGNKTLSTLTVDVNTVDKYDVSGKYVVSEINLVTNKETITDRNKDSVAGVVTKNGITYNVDIAVGTLTFTSSAKQSVSTVDSYVTMPGGQKFKYLNRTQVTNSFRNITLMEFGETTANLYAWDNITAGAKSNITIPNIPGAGTWYNCTISDTCSTAYRSTLVTPAIIYNGSGAQYIKFVDTVGAALYINVTSVLNGGDAVRTANITKAWYENTNGNSGSIEINQSVVLSGGMNVTNAGTYTGPGENGQKLLFYLTKLNTTLNLPSDAGAGTYELVLGTAGVWNGTSNVDGKQLPELYGAKLSWATTTCSDTDFTTCSTLTITEPNGNTVAVEAAKNSTNKGAAIIRVLQGSSAQDANNALGMKTFTTSWGSTVAYANVTSEGWVSDLTNHANELGNFTMRIPRYLLGFGFGEDVWSTEVTIAKGAQGNLSGTTLWVKDVSGAGDSVNAFSVGVGVLDSESPSAGWDKPLILVGGPVVNLMTQDAVDAAMIPSVDDMLAAANATDAAGWASIAVADAAIDDQTVLAVWGWDAADTRWAARALAAEVLTAGTIDGFTGASVWLNTESAAAVSDVTVRTV